MPLCGQAPGTEGWVACAACRQRPGALVTSVTKSHWLLALLQLLPHHPHHVAFWGIF